MAIASLERESPLDLLRPRELSEAELSHWRAIQAGAQLTSPFFAPDYFQLVGEVRPDVQVALLEDSSGLAGFFPFQRKNRAGSPVGYPLADFQGAIASEELAVEKADLLRQCGLSNFHFNHWVVTQPVFQQWYWNVQNSPYIDLSAGFAAYAESIAQRGGSFVSTTRRKLRKLEREVGPLRFELHTTCDDVFRRMMLWKTQQYQELRTTDLFAFAWVRELCDRVRFYEQPDFRGLMSALYAGDRLVAVHLGLSSGTVAHMWFPAYNRELERYSPGMILLLKLLERLAADGITRLDLGKGHERFKEACKTGDSQVAVGAVDRYRWRERALHWGYQAKCWTRHYPAVQGVGRIPMQMIRSLYRNSFMR